VQRDRLGRGDGEPPSGAPGEREPGHDLVVGIALPGHLGDEVAQPVGHPLSADLLEGLDDVGVMADHEVDVG
jgi:hypothetical protein